MKPKPNKMEQKQKKIIKNYIESYNSFDIHGMVRNLDANVVFENITNGKVDLKITGIDAFKKQAESAKRYFKKRNQKIEVWHVDNRKISIDIHYSATLAMDLPNGMKAGETLELKGRSEFIIENGKIKTIKDYSNG